MKKLGGTTRIVELLRSDAVNGLSARDDYSAREATFGKNHMPMPDPKSWLELFIESFEDTTVLILSAAAIVSLAVGCYDDYNKHGGLEKGWIEGVAIIVAVLIVGVVTATNDFSKAQQFAHSGA